MCRAGSESPGWLAENGPRELELLFRAIVYHPSAPILVADDDGNTRDASIGVGKLLGLPRDKIIGRPVGDFAPPACKRQVSQLWKALQERGEQAGTLRLVGSDARLRDVEYTGKANVLPVRHVIVLRDKTAPAGPQPPSADLIPAWVQDYALYLLDTEGHVAAWYSGAERIYNYRAEETIGQHVSLLYPREDTLQFRLEEELKRVAAEGHMGAEGWQSKKDGTRFWANAITMALKDGDGELQGFARVVRDFSDRHERDEKLRRNRARSRPIPSQSTVAGVVSGEFDRVPEANDAFLQLVGYSREDLLAGRLNWPDLTPPEYAPLDELAHEEGLRFGACTPFEKELIRKDGTRVPALVATAVLKLCPFRWITFVQDLRERDRLESIEEEDAEPGQDFEEIVGSSASLRRVQRQVEVVAPTDANVLILGETGTGKELVARAIHRMSPRRNLAFITLNCAAIPTGLLESELFGYERGAFTGALQQKIGRFEMAHRGTLFLDEVGDIPLDLQPKLLRALQEKSFERLGGTKTIPIDVRLVAATNRNLTQMMGDKLFRSDLYYRLKVFPITTPPLRDRPEDIPILARHFTKKYAAKMSRQIDKIPSETMRALVSWHWPGNVRELENFIERSVILSSGTSLRAPLAEIRPGATEAACGTLEQVERDHIVRVLRDSNGVVTLAAARLGLHRTTLNAMMRKLGISRKDI
ncbi:MAG TPA: sigma 54-interacting transcriptional regulator [Bryobacteraceae bacterium]|jgi:formate hydrogenlyase transcriptional activator|nr:sigma 54-interacting transcriptional regulator [Bryobacteraceae bacterium]